MAVKYIDSNATGANDGTTWANAYTTFATAAASDAAGDVFYVASDHSETTAAAAAFSWAGSIASPTRIICADKTSGSPPTTIATGAVVATTGANSTITIANSGSIYCYGITFRAGDSTNFADVVTSASSSALVVIEACALELNASSTSSRISLGDGGKTICQNCTYKFGSTSQQIIVSNARGSEITGGSINNTGSAISTVFSLFGAAASKVSGLDMSAAATTANLCSSTTSHASLLVVNCKMPASWSGSVNSSTPGPGALFQLMNSDSADTQYRIQKKTQFGNIVHDTSIYVTAGASDGTTNISWAMTSNADAEWMHQTLDSPEFTVWNETTGSSVTVTVEFLIDSATTLNNNDVWMEVTYLGTSGYPLGSVDTDSRCATYLTTPTECTTGAGLAAWTGESGSAKSYKLTSTITPQEKGVISVVVKLAKASTTIYVDPKITLS